MMTVSDLLKNAVQQLKHGLTDTPLLDAEVLLLHTMRVSGMAADKVFLISHSEDPVDETLNTAFMNKVAARCIGKPVQYIIESQEFMGLDFYVPEGVLIPRPDTEIIVEKLLDLYKAAADIKIIDMCTGTGAIAVSLAYYIKEAFVYAVDLSPAAIECCLRNRAKHHLESRIEVIQSNLFDALINKKLKNRFDLVVSNPPYIEKNEISKLSDSVKCFEPLLALDGGIDGLDFYRQITRDAAYYLKSGGILAYEIGYNQGEAVMQIIKGSGFYTDVFIEKDLAGLDRCIWARCH
jgi:release factor glutamine methyltransferase